MIQFKETSEDLKVHQKNNHILKTESILYTFMTAPLECLMCLRIIGMKQKA